MLRIALTPSLSTCIETVARKEYQATTKALLVADDLDCKLVRKAEVLKAFLERADFRKLRAESEAQLLRGRAVIFTVFLEDGNARQEMKVL